ncbi:MAG: OpgC domain-containing protein [Alphaproteobacteria bacterium]|nr:OpgC domain-containing protein [Alphaproteobacteria bacterium SS10]
MSEQQQPNALPGQGAALAEPPARNPERVRDPRLDFFRGICMFIILLAHTPGNPWTLWIPARFGYSDATEIFVFCSGMASAIAFGKVFDNAGWFLGAARVAYRVWQVYWAHIALFFIIAAMLVVMNEMALVEKDQVGRLNLYPFFNNPMPQIVGLFTLTYVPNYFDILPMYLVILCLLPVVMLLSRMHVALVLAFVSGLYALAHFQMLQLPAEPWSDREWFFNPFAWQLVFFTGYAFMRGWIPAPPIDYRLVILAAVIVLAAVPTAYFRVYRLDFVIFGADLLEWRRSLKPVINKTDFGLFRYIHFLALAYLAYAAVGEGGRRLMGSGIKAKVIAVIRKVGQQSLAVFLLSMVLGRVGGFAFDYLGKDWYTVIAVNLTGFGLLIITAYLVGWFKGQPWRKPKAPKPTPAEPVTSTSSSASMPPMQGGVPAR